MGIKYSLNKFNIAHLGVADEFYNLYEFVRETCQTIAEDIRKNNPNDLLKLRIVEKKAAPAIRQRVNDFLEDYTYLFTSEFDRIDVKISDFNRSWFTEFDRKRPFSTPIISFSKFLVEFQKIVCSAIAKRKNYVYSALAEEKVSGLINRHIDTLADSVVQQTIKHTKDLGVKQKELIIYTNLSIISCCRNHHNIVPDMICIPLILEDKSIVLPVHRCTDCNKVFVGNETLKAYQEYYGKLFVALKKDISFNTLEIILKNESALHKAGYNVVEGNLSQEERRALLISFLKTKTFTYYEICKDIEKAINLFKHRYKYINAVKKWRSDLLFLGEYVKTGVHN